MLSKDAGADDHWSLQGWVQRKDHVGEIKKLWQSEVMPKSSSYTNQRETGDIHSCRHFVFLPSVLRFTCADVVPAEHPAVLLFSLKRR